MKRLPILALSALLSLSASAADVELGPGVLMVQHDRLVRPTMLLVK